jgi:hypothetical protein
MTDREAMQMALETAEQIACADYRHWEELASLSEFERWARSRANHIAEALRARLAQPEPEPVAWEVWTIHNHIFFSIGVQSFQINDVLEHQPEVLAEEFSEWLATQLRHALTQLSNTAPPQREWVGLTDGDVNYCVDAIYKGFDVKPRNEVEIAYFERLIKFIDRKLKEKNAT